MSTTIVEDGLAEPELQAEHEADSAGTRRAALKAGAVALAGLFAPALAGAQGVRKKAPPSIGPKPSSSGDSLDVNHVDPTAIWASPELRLARRLTYGVTDADATQAKQLGYDAYLEYHLAATQNDDAAEQFVFTNYPYAGYSAAQLVGLDSGQVQTQLINSLIYRAAFSTRQLKERMVEFWSDHFNMSYEKVGSLKVIDDRDVIRANALTTFPNLLRASSKSVAMLTYLDQTTSRASAPNQNYAREIMELHSLGVDGGYTQDDVAELSRVLTGWTNTAQGVFTFNPALHDFKAKTVLGVSIPAAASTPNSTAVLAVQEGELMVNFLALHPSTATFISTKMLKYFLRYDPSPAQIAQVAGVYAATQGDIKSMLRAVLSKANLLAAPAKFKRPYHLVISGLRAMGAQVVNAATVSSWIATAGQQPFDWQTPDGYPDRAEYWAGNILPRWNFAVSLANSNTATNVVVNTAPFMTATTAAGVVANIDRYCFAGEMSQRLRDELTSYIGSAPTSTTRVREALSLALSCSTFQYY